MAWPRQGLTILCRMASDLVPICLSVTEGDLYTLWAPRWREGGDEWEAFLGAGDDLYGFADAADLIRTEVMHMSDDLGRLRERVLKLQKDFGSVNEDVRQILISADKIEKRAGRIEELDFSKDNEPAETTRVVSSSDLFPPHPLRKLQAGE